MVVNMVENKPKIIIEESEALKLKRKSLKGKVHKPELENDDSIEIENLRRRYSAERCEEEIEVKGQRIYDGKINTNKAIKDVESLLTTIEV